MLTLWISRVTNELCTITQADYELAWNAATADTANTDAVAAFCADNCLTQTIVLNAPTQENLNDLQLMCKNEKILDYPFIEHMIFAKLVRRPDAAAQGDTLGPGLEGLVAPGSGRMGGHSGSSASSSLLSYGLSWIIAPLATIHLIYWL